MSESTAAAVIELPPAAGSRPGLRGLRRVAALCGPAFIVSVAYVDPGNFATNMAGGASYGDMLLWVIAAANLIAMFVQSLSAKLGIATGQSLPALCRAHLPRPVTWLLWIQGELVAACTDLAEFLGGAIALNLLFGTPLVAAAVITAAVSSALLMLAPGGRHRYEAVITGLLAVICVGFVYQAVLVGHLGTAAHGLAPRLAGQGSVLLAAGIVGATVMPHVIYLHSALTRDHARRGGHQAALRASRIDITGALGIAALVNMAMMIVAAAVLHGGAADSLTSIHDSLDDAIGGGAAAAFALALLASGLASSSVGTYAGQVIMEGFLQTRIPLAVRRLATIAPAIAILATGTNPVRLLILSQVALTAGLPFALVPLTILTSSKKVMGTLVNRPVTTVAAVGVTLVIVALNATLLIQAAAA
ncbi:MAG TPA: Nramp family divalent metal transporter [Trebonia sp.]|nr:Nramp family divalent metal transporter [Trebonia sp.]